jgi:hypothetical protein
MSEIPATPAEAARKRDALAQACFALHFAIMVFIVFGWAIPQSGVLVFYLALLPAVVLQWQFNKSTCVLNNFESWLRTGRWRDEGNPEEGAWLLTLVRNALGLELHPAHLDIFIHTVMVIFWGLGLAHLLRG